MTTFALGPLLFAAVGVCLSLGTRTESVVPRVAAAVAGLGLATFLPQFFLPPTGRVAHGLVLGAALVLLAATAGRARRASGAGATPSGAAR